MRNPTPRVRPETQIAEDAHGRPAHADRVRAVLRHDRQPEEALARASPPSLPNDKRSSRPRGRARPAPGSARPGSARRRRPPPWSAGWTTSSRTSSRATGLASRSCPAIDQQRVEQARRRAADRASGRGRPATAGTRLGARAGSGRGAHDRRGGTRTQRARTGAGRAAGVTRRPRHLGERGRPAGPLSAQRARQARRGGARLAGARSARAAPARARPALRRRPRALRLRGGSCGGGSSAGRIRGRGGGPGSSGRASGMAGGSAARGLAPPRAGESFSTWPQALQKRAGRSTAVPHDVHTTARGRDRRERRPALPAEHVALAIVGLAGRAYLARGADGCGTTFAARLLHLLAEEQARGADGHEVPVAQVPLADAVPVDQRSVGGVAVAQEVLAAAVLDHGVAPRHHGVGQDHVVGGIAPDRDRASGPARSPAARRRSD